MEALALGERKAENHGFEGKYGQKQGKISVLYRYFAPGKGKTSDFSGTKYGTFAPKTRHF